MNCPRCDYKLDVKCKECSRCGLELPKQNNKIEPVETKNSNQLLGILNKFKKKEPEVIKKPEKDFSDVINVLQNHIKIEPKQIQPAASAYLMTSPFKSAVQKIVHQSKDEIRIERLMAEETQETVALKSEDISLNSSNIEPELPEITLNPEPIDILVAPALTEATELSSIESEPVEENISASSDSDDLDLDTMFNTATVPTPIEQPIIQAEPTNELSNLAVDDSFDSLLSVLEFGTGTNNSSTPTEANLNTLQTTDELDVLDNIESSPQTVEIKQQEEKPITQENIISSSTEELTPTVLTEEADDLLQTLELSLDSNLEPLDEIGQQEPSVMDSAINLEALLEKLSNEPPLIKVVRKKTEIELFYEQELGRELEPGELEALTGQSPEETAQREFGLESFENATAQEHVEETTTSLNQKLNLDSLELEQELEMSLEQELEMSNETEQELEEQSPAQENCYVLDEEDSDLDSLLKELESSLEN